MKDNILAIIIGIAASLIATILWWGLTQLISFRARKKIRYYISCLRTDNASFEKQLEYKDYDLALQQTHRLLTRIGEIFYSIKGLTYLPRKRKLINTLLLSLHLKLSEFQLAYKGYETKQEKDACCEDTKRKWHPNQNTAEEFSVGQYTVELLSAMNNSKSSITSILKGTTFFQDIDMSILKRQLKQLIEVQSFKNAFSKEVGEAYCFTNDTYTREEYYKLIDRL